MKRDIEKKKTAFRASLIWRSEPVLTYSQIQTEQAISIGTKKKISFDIIFLSECCEL